MALVLYGTVEERRSDRRELCPRKQKEGPPGLLDHIPDARGRVGCCFRFIRRRHLRPRKPSKPQGSDAVAQPPGTLRDQQEITRKRLRDLARDLAAKQRELQAAQDELTVRQADAARNIPRGRTH